MDFDTKQIRRFLIVAEEGSFTRAAKRLHVSQSSLTRTISAIELATKTKLLERTTRKVELTSEGRIIKEELQRWLSDLDAIFTIHDRTRALRLGFNWALPDIWIGCTLQNFESDTRTKVDFVRSDARYAGVDSGDVDVAVIRGTINATGLQTVPLFQEHRVLAVQKDNALILRPRISWAEVARYPLVVNEGNGITRPTDWPAGNQPIVSARCRNLDEWLELIAAGRGVGVATVNVPRHLSHPRVRFLPLDAAPKVPVFLIHPRQGAHPLTGRFVRAAIRAVDHMRSVTNPMQVTYRRDLCEKDKSPGPAR